VSLFEMLLKVFQCVVDGSLKQCVSGIVSVPMVLCWCISQAGSLFTLATQCPVISSLKQVNIVMCHLASFLLRCCFCCLASTVCEN